MKNELLEVAQASAHAAANILLDHLGTASIDFKAEQTHNLVTAADVAAEAAILAQIKQAFPNHQVLGEEGLSQADEKAEHLWVVDPLDGTTNYAHQIPQFCTAISYVRSGVVEVGVVLDPSRNEMFHAVRGEGAWLNDQPIHVSDRSLTESVIATGFYYDRGELMQRTLAAIGALFQKNIRGIRRLGSAALDQAWVACGRMDGFFEYQLSPWDYAAASLIVEEAGGRCSDRAGNRLSIGSGSLIAANSVLFDDLLSTVRWPADR